jgi:hypothetical protein
VGERERGKEGEEGGRRRDRGKRGEREGEEKRRKVYFTTRTYRPS